jgi:hypothetical protein
VPGRSSVPSFTSAARRPASGAVAPGSPWPSPASRHVSARLPTRPSSRPTHPWPRRPHPAGRSPPTRSSGLGPPNRRPAPRHRRAGAPPCSRTCSARVALRDASPPANRPGLRRLGEEHRHVPG